MPEVVLVDTMYIQGCICLAVSSRLLPEFSSEPSRPHMPCFEPSLFSIFHPATGHSPVSQVSNAVISDLLQRGPQQGLSGATPRSDAVVEICVQGSASDYGA